MYTVNEKIRAGSFEYLLKLTDLSALAFVSSCIKGI